MQEGSAKALELLIEAKRSAEFINEDFYILESTIALGDYYYNNQETYKEALVEYFKALKISGRVLDEAESSKIKLRIKDMELRMDSEVYKEIENKYGERV